MKYQIPKLLPISVLIKVFVSLQVLETCVKNCGIRFHSKIAQRDFLHDMMKVISVKNNPPTIVRERILGLVQYWADAFKGKHQLVAVDELYEQLKTDGIEFPPIDLDNLTPVETQGRSQVHVCGTIMREDR